MEEQSSNNNPLGDLFSSIKHYIDLRSDEVKLTLAENMAKILSRVIFFLLLFILIGIVLGIIAAALSSWFAVIVGNKTIGLLITAGLFIVVILCLFTFKDRFLINSMLRMFLRMFSKTGKMEKDRIDYRNIRTLQELQYHRRLLSSRIDHQEIMVMYKLRCVWEFISPSNLFSMGCRAIASYNPSFGFIYRTVEFLKGFIKRRKTTD